MSAPEIEIVNINNFEKIQNFLNDSAYKEILENSENYNTRLCIERRLRMPFLDPQTGVAQTHCALFVKQKQRMPGFREGQIYTYPSNRWRKPKRQYLLNHHHSYRHYQYRESNNHHHHHYNASTGTGASGRDHSENAGRKGRSTKVKNKIDNEGDCLFLFQRQHEFSSLTTLDLYFNFLYMLLGGFVLLSFFI